MLSFDEILCYPVMKSCDEIPGADPGFLKGGVHLRSTSKKRGGGGGAKRGSNFGPNVKNPTSWPKGGGGSGPPGPPLDPLLKSYVIL